MSGGMQEEELSYGYSSPSVPSNCNADLVF